MPYEPPLRTHRSSSSLILRIAILAVLAEVGAATLLIIVLPESAPAPSAVNGLILLNFGISALITLTVLWMLGLRLRRETRGVARTARRLAETDFEFQPSRPTILELAELTSTLDGMALQLTEHLQALNTQRSEQAAVLRSIDIGLIAIDREQQVLSMNRSALGMFGIHGSEVRGRLLQEIINEPELNDFVTDALEDPTTPAVEFHLMDRREITVRASAGDLRNARNEIVGIVIVLNDVTKIRRLESMRSDFAANVSHELRTPMTNIKGYTETLLDTDLVDQEQTRDFLKVIARNANRLGAIVEDMMALARLDRVESLESFDPKTVSLRDVTEGAIHALTQESEVKSMTISNAIDAADRAFGNAQMIEQALLNLISNAIKYTPIGTCITISARTILMDDEGEELSADHGSEAPLPRPGIAITVEDQGPGIAREHLPRIFERFYRVDKARSREAGGTGLGLAIVKHIALVHGGSVKAASTVGKGSRFTMILPQPR